MTWHIRALFLITAALTASLTNEVCSQESPHAASLNRQYIIDKFLQPEPDHLVESARRVILAKLLVRSCRSQFNPIVLQNFLQQAGLIGLDKDRQREIQDTASMRFDYLETKAVEVLCSDINEFFGADGKLIKGLIVPAPSSSVHPDPAVQSTSQKP